MIYTVAVRELCEFTAKQGDLDLRFTPAPTAQEGIAGHATAARRRGSGYQREVSLSGQFEKEGQTLQVRGRADGYDAADQRLDEVKTHKGTLDRQPATHRHLHWAQAKIYGWLLCQLHGLPALKIALVYLDITTQHETVLTELHTADTLRAHFELQCSRFLHWASEQVAHRAARNTALQHLAFPFGDFRTGQRPLAEAAYKAAATGRCLLAQAPTGIGKTMGTLFPTLKALPGAELDKVFYLAAKTSGRQMALDALARLGHAPVRRDAGSDDAANTASTSVGYCAQFLPLPLRVLELIARDKACEHPDKACHGESCPLAQGFYDRLPAARTDAVLGAHAGAPLTQAAVRAVALRHSVCPYYLSQELARWADVVVGDYNYYFDQGGLLHGLAQANQWRCALLVDEAHNLVERARKMYTAQLHPATLAQARRSAAALQHPPIKKALAKVRRAWVAFDKSAAAPYAVFDEFPAPLLAALQQANATVGEYFAEHPTAADPALQTWYFDSLHLCRMADLLDAHSMVDASAPSIASKPGESTLCIRCVVPAPFLAPRWQAAHSSTLFSATLQPAHYYTQLLGLPERTVGVDVPSPFSASQLQVHVARDISTRYAHRAASLQAVVQRMATQFAQRPGNYLAFFSSYDYLQLAADALCRLAPDIPHWRQARRMSETEQRDFLDRFTASSQGIGFAVLGGAFSEGIDLPGQRLIGAFLATLGLPQLNPVNEQIRQRMQTLFGSGYDYTYLYPGLQKAVQAAGRVIRTPNDTGVLHLMDDRYARADVRALLPSWWQLDPSGEHRG